MHWQIGASQKEDLKEIDMSGAKKFRVWLFFIVLGCGEPEMIPANSLSKGEVRQQDGSGKADGVADGGTHGVSYGIGLCMDAFSGASDQRVIFTPKPKDGACGYAQNAMDFTAGYERPVVLELHGISYVSYRIDVMRSSGYITISHRAGDVTHIGDTFSWYLVPGSEQPEEARVLSLTANASFKIVVR
ncbi:hypothetical protein HZA42_02160 [Candidatus Peregrinibacteria bacterium]|nr:hypothetical protein [Candidatus Peregrinibacteria bacterium]